MIKNGNHTKVPEEQRLPYYTRVVAGHQEATKRPLAVIVAGHNGSGKSTLWYGHLAQHMQIPLVNADRMMLSILPDAGSGKPLPEWAATIRDNDKAWMRIAQKGVQAFVAQIMEGKLPFATEPVFSHWKDNGDGKIESKIDLIRDLQKQGYFVLLFFVGLTDCQLSIARVETRKLENGHGVPHDKLIDRFPRTQRAIHLALNVADAAILVDNSRAKNQAFTFCRAQIKDEILFDLRNDKKGQHAPQEITTWMNAVCPL